MIRVPQFLLSCFALLLALPAFGQSKPDCSALPDHTKLRSVLQSVVKEGATGNSGLGNQEWAVTVNRDGVVCSVVFSGNDRGQQWPGSRAIAAEKANTANALSSSDYALSTANVFAASQPGQSLYSLQQARLQIRRLYSVPPHHLAPPTTPWSESRSAV